MAAASLDPGEGLVDLTRMSLSELAELDDDVVARAVDRLVGRCDTGDRLWQADPTPPRDRPQEADFAPPGGR
ncbi:hypothetical protein [Nonomuraea sp. NPDC050310]|uniref:hypothetical protein n=1 Tax=Nonomuraea sp. NPDC050310 TaxID=3154935 RepID=UPI0033C5244F